MHDEELVARAFLIALTWAEDHRQWISYESKGYTSQPTMEMQLHCYKIDDNTKCQINKATSDSSLSHIHIRYWGSLKPKKKAI